MCPAQGRSSHPNSYNIAPIIGNVLDRWTAVARAPRIKHKRGLIFVPDIIAKIITYTFSSVPKDGVNEWMAGIGRS